MYKGENKMSIKKGTYKVDNGSTYDEIMFKTTADQVFFTDGQTFQEKLSNGTLKGTKGDTGPQGPIGPTGSKGDTGAPGINATTTKVATTDSNGLMGAEMVTKLNGIEAEANNYSHPFTHSATMITETSGKRFVSDTEKTNWNDARTKALDWNKFKTNGGDISGRVNCKEINVGEVRFSKDLFGANKFDIVTLVHDSIHLESTKNGKSATLQIDSNTQSVRSSPFNSGTVSLGTDTVPWLNIWLKGYSDLMNGYTKLSNGFILQWGTISGQTNLTNVYFPIAFPTKSLFVSAQLNNGRPINMTLAVAMPEVSKFQIIPSDTSVSYGFSWMAIGY